MSSSSSGKRSLLWLHMLRTHTVTGDPDYVFTADILWGRSGEGRRRQLDCRWGWTPQSRCHRRWQQCFWCCKEVVSEPLDFQKRMFEFHLSVLNLGMLFEGTVEQSTPHAEYVFFFSWTPPVYLLYLQLRIPRRYRSDQNYLLVRIREKYDTPSWSNRIAYPTEQGFARQHQWLCPAQRTLHSSRCSAVWRSSFETWPSGFIRWP